MNVGQEVAGAIFVQPPYYRADGNRNVGVLAVGPPLVLTLAMAAGLAVDRAVELDVQQGIVGRISHQIGAAPVAPITPVRPALRPVLLPKEAGAAVPAVASPDVQPYCVNHVLSTFFLVVIRYI